MGKELTNVQNHVMNSWEIICIRLLKAVSLYHNNKAKQSTLKNKDYENAKLHPAPIRYQ